MKRNLPLYYAGCAAVGMFNAFEHIHIWQWQHYAILGAYMFIARPFWQSRKEPDTLEIPFKNPLTK